MSESRSIITINTVCGCFKFACVNKCITHHRPPIAMHTIIKVIYPHEGVAMVRVSSEESPPDEKEHDESNASKRTILETVSVLTSQLLDEVHTCFNKSSQLIRTAALRYFILSSLNRPDISPMRSRLSPRYSRSSIFFVMTLVTSRSSSLSLSRFAAARLFW